MAVRVARLLPLVVVLLVGLPAVAMAQDEYDFDVSEFERKPYEWGGLVGLTPTLLLGDTDAALYHQRYFETDEARWLGQAQGEAQLEGFYRGGNARWYGRLDGQLIYDDRGWDERLTLQELNLNVQDSPTFTARLGKQTFKWGTGYAFNPVAFLDRPRMPEDPELAMEGFTTAAFDIINSFAGPLTTLTITPVLAPVLGNLNEDLYPQNGMVAALKIYTLFYDTDIDLIGLAGTEMPPRYGFDVSRNLRPELEMHGEMAFTHERKKVVLDRQGNLRAEKLDAFAALAGVRYLAATNTTLILEYFYNEAGYTQTQWEDYAAFVAQAYRQYEQTGNEMPLKKARRATAQGYGRPDVGRHNLYLRISHPEPFDLVYSSVGLMAIADAADGSFQLIPEYIYSGWGDFELRLRGGLLHGAPNTQFGEKAVDGRIEMRVRYYF